jgi:hypothetical protein
MFIKKRGKVGMSFKKQGKNCVQKGEKPCKELFYIILEEHIKCRLNNGFRVYRDRNLV